MAEPTSADLIDRFLAAQGFRGLSPATIKRRRWTLTTFAGVIAPDTLATTSTEAIEAFLGQRQTAATRRALLGDFRAFYRWANRRGVLDVDPVAILETPKVPRRAPTPLSRAELDRAIEQAGYEMRLIILLGAHAGLRVSEMSALHRRDIDLEARRLVVRGGKGGKDRIVPISDTLAELLRYCGPGVVISSYSCAGSISNAVRDHFRSLGIRRRTHDLRATFATEAAAVAGGNIVLVQQLLGHSSPTTTMRYMAWHPDGGDIVNAMYAGGERASVSAAGDSRSTA